MSSLIANFVKSRSMLKAAPMVYIQGEEMTRYTCQLMMDHWIAPRIDTKNWEFFDLSCKNRDDTNDEALRNAVSAGYRVGAIFKEPTITPTDTQQEQMGLRRMLPSPNGAMRRGWNGITISRDTIHIKGLKLGFQNPVLFERHAVGGEYGAGWRAVGNGRLECRWYPDASQAGTVIDGRETVHSIDLTDKNNVAVVYHNPLDNVEDMAHYFFKRCLEAKVVPYVVTKKTVFKWQESFWSIMKKVFDDDYRADFLTAGLLQTTEGHLQHLISDAATMQIIRWTGGGFGMAAHNYDGDMLTDEIAQVHRSPGFITSNLIGRRGDGTFIKEFEASHGTVTDHWLRHLRGEETSLNPLGLAEALIGAMQHSAELHAPGSEDTKLVHAYTNRIREVMHECMVIGQGTRDLCGPSGLTTEGFIDVVKRGLEGEKITPRKSPSETQFEELVAEHHVDMRWVDSMFKEFDEDKNGSINKEEFTKLLIKIGVAPLKMHAQKDITKLRTPTKNTEDQTTDLLNT